MSRKKVTVVGAGFVGATTAQRLVERQLSDVVLVDVVEGLAKGKALDMMQAASIEGFDTQIIGTHDYAETAGSDVVVVTAGVARKPGMSRDDLVAINAKIVAGVVAQVAGYSPKAILIIVTNPLDVMTYLAQKASGFPSSRVFGMAGVLDSARYAYFIAEALDCSPKDVRAMVLGGHGDSMVPVPDYSTVNGVPITQLLSVEKITEINDRTRNGGAEIVGLLKSGSAYYAPSSSVVAMVEAVLLNSRRILPVCAYLQGEYDLKDLYCGVPAVLGSQGVERIIELTLSSKDHLLLKTSAQAVSAVVGKVG